MSPARGYCTLDQVAAWKGADLTATEAAKVTAWMDLAENLIDAETSHPFLTAASGVITAERHAYDGPRVWTHQRPISSVQAVRGYRHGDTTATDLLVTTDYELEDAARGQIYVRPWRVWHWLQVDYTVPLTVPPEVSEATAALLAHALVQPAVITGGTVVREKFADAEQQYAAPAAGAAEGGMPPDVRALLGRWARNGVVFA